MEKFRVFYKDDIKNKFSWFDGFFSDIDTYIDHLDTANIIAIAVPYEDEETKARFLKFCDLVNREVLINEI